MYFNIAYNNIAELLNIFLLILIFIEYLYKSFYRILNNNGHIIAFKNNIRISFTEL